MSFGREGIKLCDGVDGGSVVVVVVVDMAVGFGLGVVHACRSATHLPSTVSPPLNQPQLFLSPSSAVVPYDNPIINQQIGHSSAIDGVSPSQPASALPLSTVRGGTLRQPHHQPTDRPPYSRHDGSATI
ncbi:hypothetical protein OIU79_000782 [Salix purpurea]|uniref:Uncharacterized protein n=1 Tax=Salix purpurea TaxID=77065 RepID=A0A9Q0V259_SALPP|nr:hypothetical protein OIU79_000782 [Salix purpurea]